MSDSSRPDGILDNSRNNSAVPANTTAASFQVDNTKTLPVAVGSPRPIGAGPMAQGNPQQSPAAFAPPNGSTQNVPNGINGIPGRGQGFHQPNGQPIQNGHPHPAPTPAATLIYDFKYRAPGRGASLHT